MPRSGEPEPGLVPAPEGEAGPRPCARPACWRALAAALACSLVISVFPAPLSSAGLHFGIISAVKSKVKELGKKVRERAAPDNLTAVAVSSSAVQLSWRDNAKDETSFSLERRQLTTEPFLPLAVAPRNATAYLDSGLGANVTYYYRLRANTPAGWTDYSAEAKSVTMISNQRPVAGPKDSGTGKYSISIGTTQLLEVVGMDADGDPLQFNWINAQGIRVGTGPNLMWTAPMSTGTFALSCYVTDGRGGETEVQFTIDVNNPPVVTITAVPPAVLPSGVSTFTCSAVSPVNDAMSYSWISDVGSYTLLSSTQLVWTAPAEPGTYRLFCDVTYGTGAVKHADRSIAVSTAPVIISIIAPLNVMPNEIASITADVASPSGSPVSYSWLDSGGIELGSAILLNWQAPADTGTYTITLVVSDDSGGYDIESVDISVNSGPTISNVTASPRVILPLGVSTLTCTATDPDSPELSYFWITPYGVVSALGTGTALWTAPAEPGIYQVDCAVMDEAYNMSAQKNVSIRVSTFTQILSLTPDPGKVRSGASNRVICDAESPYAAGITYSWHNSGGAFSGAGSTIAWTAPADTGTYLITCGANDGHTPEVFRSTTVLVNNPPSVSSLAAVPSIMWPTEISTLTCYATDPDNLTVDLTWNFHDGTWTPLSYNSVAWTAPAVTGTYSGTCEASDGEGGSDQLSAELLVTTMPVILSLVPTPPYVGPSKSMSLVCTATAPHNSPLTYAWSADSGTFSSGGGSTATWTAPASTGTYPLTCSVTDGDGNIAMRSVDGVVLLVPELNSLRAAPAMVRPQENSALTCAVADPLMPGLYYDWAADSGAVVAAGPGAATWTAPESTGTFRVYCRPGVEGGGSAEDFVNIRVATSPVIDSLVSTPPKVSTGGYTSVVCLATAPGSVPLTYTWNADSGSYVGSGSTISWHAPDSTGTAIISCLAAGSGGNDYAEISVLVNNPPVISSLVAVPAVIRPTQISTVTCAATDPDNPQLVYEWTVQDGTYTELGTGVIAWTPPETGSGAYFVGCKVADGEGGDTSASVQIIVATMPVILSYSAEPPMISTNEVSHLLCVSTAPDSTPLTYTWSAGSGSITNEEYDHADWTAPLVTGTYPVTCMVSSVDGTAVRSVAVRVVNPPVITSLSAAPAIVWPGAVSTITCTASDPDNAPLTYEWSAASGSLNAFAPGFAAWVAPADPDVYTIKCGVTDEEGASVSSEVEVRVSSGPEILSLGMEPGKLRSGGLATGVCIATAPGNVPLTYGWTATGGSISGAGSTSSWTAPMATGTYTIGCSVTMGSLTALEELNVLVNNPPEISDFITAPGIVVPGGFSTVTCIAADIDNPVIYDWTFGAGTYTVLGEPGQVRWEAPASTGSYSALCVASDGEGGEDNAGGLIIVASGPVILSFTVEPMQVPPGSEAALVCVATAPGSGVLIYDWAPGSGSVAGTGREVTWTAPASTGVYKVTCGVTDEGGTRAAQELDITVNTLPVISGVAPAPSILLPSEISTITCTAADAETALLAYTWDPGPGTYVVLSTGVIAWRAQASTGTAEVACSVLDEQGGSARRAATLIVSSLPVITELTANPDAVSSGAVSNVVCLATAPGGVSLSYSWAADSGTLSASGRVADWTAPVSTGTYAVTCTADAGGGKTASRSVSVLVNNPPLISELFSSPSSLPPLGVSTITCAASDPDNPVLFYEWVLGGGTSQYLDIGQILWSAPASTGKYRVSCRVADGEGGLAERAISVWVATGPVITSLTADPVQVSTGASANLVCLATSPAGMPLDYSWSAGSGTVTGTGDRVSWAAPADTGTFSVQCLVDDGAGIASAVVDILVNNPPVISSVTAAPQIVAPLEASTITCSASDPDNPELFYSWSLPGGTSSYIEAGKISWTAPESSGTYTIGCEASDGEGGKASGEVDVMVASGPVITSFSAQPEMIPRLGTSDLICVATAPGSLPLTYAWTSASGTFTVFPDSAAWTAPDATGTYRLGCGITTPGGGYAGESLEIMVNSPAHVSSVTASATVVATGAPVELTCFASDPDNDPLIYFWSASTGVFAGSGSTATWTAPVSTGAYMVSCQVSDGKAPPDGQASVEILVSTGPAIRSVTASPATIPRLGQSSVVCVATAPAGGINYSFSADSGSLAQYVSSASWTAPDSTGTYQVVCVAGSPGGGSASEGVEILVNSPPVLSSVTATPSVLSTGAVSELGCFVSDADGDALVFQWTVDGGTLTGSGSTVTWTSPLSTGTFEASCQVSDGKPGGSVQAAVTLLVATGPAITALQVVPETVLPGASASVVCVATAPGGGGLTYEWLKSSGTFAEYVTSATWTAPNATGTYSVGCAVTDGLTTSSRLAEVLVNSPPLISAVSAEPSVVSTGAVSTVTCTASDPDGDGLVYNWTAPYGAISAAGPVAYWTAPAAAGSYSLTCEASDGKSGGAAQLSVSILAATGPVITSFTLAPAMIPRLGETVLVCAATAPANAPIAYSWLASTGTPDYFQAFVSSAVWTAPDSTGTWQLGCEATAAGRSSLAWSEIIVNSPPQISSVTASPRVVSTLTAVALSCAASDPDGDAIAYAWLAATGVFSGSGSSVTWTSPESTGTYQVTCRVEDGKPGSFSQAMTQVTVATAPVITRLTAAPMTVPREGVSSIVCAATAPAAGLTYTFNAAAGTFENFVSSALWTAPNATGTVVVSCLAEGAGGSDWEGVEVLVNSPPTASSITVLPGLVSTGSPAALYCHASDPDFEQLEYTWSAGTGVFTGAGSSVTWVSGATGIFQITCSVSDGKQGGASQTSAQVIVATGPTILSFTASPDLVLPGGASELVCVATAPDSAEISYTWLHSAGSTVAYVSSATWTAPAATGTYTLSCLAAAGAGGAVSSVEVLVNTPPQLAGVTAVPPFISTGAQSALTCSASDPDGDALEYEWSVGTGVISGTGPTVTWTAPETQGDYQASCRVSDGKRGGAATGSVNLRVATGPIITALSFHPEFVPRQGSVDLVCVATAPDYAAMSYVWSSTAGALSYYASTASWTAPNATGTYTVACEVTAGGEMTRSSVGILVNSPPVISSVSLGRQLVSTDTAVAALCSASDPDGDDLTYNWTATSGSFSGASPSVIWTSPVSTGMYTLNCEVSDGKANGLDSDSAQVLVTTGPSIISMTAGPTPIPRSGTSYAVCLATAPDGALDYTWSADSGSIAAVYQTSAAWTAPNATGTWHIGCQVSVAGGGSAFASAPVLVNSPPLVTGVTAQPAMVSTMTVSTLTCVATDPDSDELVYTWFPDSGTVITAGHEVQWVSPPATGTWRIGCMVSDGKDGGTAQGEVSVLVSTYPLISSFSAVPTKVSTGAVSTMTCLAAAPGGGPVSYGWFAAAGSTQTLGGDDSQIRWTAPAATGTVSVTCVAAGAGGSDRRSLSILVNNPPVIASLSASPVTIATGAVSTITCTASDPDNLVLAYTWTMQGGSSATLSPSQIAWTGPAEGGYFDIGCEVSDGEGGVTRSTVTVTVSPNRDPVIDSLTASPSPVVSGGATQVTCAVTEPDDDTVSYEWAAASGTLSGSGAAVNWTLPSDTGTYLVSCSVSDGKGGHDAETLGVLVNNPPAISALSAQPSIVSTGAVSTVTCAAADADTSVVFYNWYAAFGSTAPIGLDGTQVRWTAPAAAGLYQVQCTALDGEGGSDVESVEVTVSSTPVIHTLSAIPSRVEPGGTALLTCGADGQDSLPVTYGWFATCGSTAVVAGEPYSTNWTAPASTGACTVTCSAAAGGGTAYRGVVMSVNTAPSISLVSAAPLVLEPLSVSTAACFASDADGDALTYEWLATGGSTAAVPGFVSSAAWTAPASSGTYSLTCRVSDGKDLAQGSVSLTVSSVPLIGSLTAQPPNVMTNGISTFTCAASDPDGDDPVTYAWYATGGSTAAIAGDGSQARWTAPATSGTFVMTCAATSGGGTAYVDLSITSGGTLDWVNQDGSTDTDSGRAVAMDASGNIYVAGSVKAPLLAEATYYGNLDAVLIKYDPAGTRLWVQQFGTGSADEAAAVALDASGNIFVAGYTNAALNGEAAIGGRDAFVVKFGPTGTRWWTRQFGTMLDEYDSNGVAGFGVAVDTTGSVYVSGATFGDMGGGGNAGNADAFVTKYSPAGTFQWTKQLGTSGHDSAHAVTVDAGGAVYIAGRTNGRLLPGTTWYGGQDGFVARYTAAGDQVWVRQIGTAAGTPEGVRGISADLYGGGVYAAGVTGGSLAGANAGGNDAFLAKYDVNGSTAWVRQFGTNLQDIGYAVSASSGYVYVGGQTSGVLSGNQSQGATDFFVARYGSDGTSYWLQQYGSPSGDNGYGVAADTAGGAVVVGDVMGVITGETAIGPADIAVAKYNKGPAD